MTLSIKPALLVLVAATTSLAQEVVVPNIRATVEGPNNNNLPFTSTQLSIRYQQVHAATEFSALGGPRRLVEIRFRPDAGLTYPAWSTDVTLDLRVSTTQKAPDGLSETFAENVGPDEVVVYTGLATLATTQTGPALPGPQQFDVVITFQAPFLYDPSAGNLLWDVRRDGTTITASRALDTDNATGDGGSRMFNSSSSSSPTASNSSSGCIVTKFIFEIPECYPDCNHDGVLTLADFGCFQTWWAFPENYVDCNQDGVRNLADFGCFQTKFALGCP